MHVKRWRSNGSSTAPPYLTANWGQKRSSSSPPSLNDATESLNGLYPTRSIEQNVAGPPYGNEFHHFPDVEDCYGTDFIEASRGGVGGVSNSSLSYWSPSPGPSKNSSMYEPSVSDDATSLSGKQPSPTLPLASLIIRQ
jgi:hypothetical protein